MKQSSRDALLMCAVLSWLAMPVYGAEERIATRDIIVQATPAEEEAKYESQQKTIITKADIEKKQAKSVEDIVFNETGVSRTVDSMGRVGVSIRGAEPRHTLILVDGQPVMGDLAKYSGVPVWNGLTDDFHPTQMLADIMTVQEEFGDVRGRKLTFFGDARNNVANSLMVVCAKLGMHFCACGPKELMPKQELIDKCEAIAKDTHAVLEFTDDVKVGAKDADVLYTDIWLSMGEPEELWAQRIELLRPYQVNKEVMAAAKPTAIFLHCLPSFHDRHTTIGENIYQKYGLEAMEVTDDVFLGHQAREFEEAENRMHTIKAVMYATLK